MNVKKNDIKTLNIRSPKKEDWALSINDIIHEVHKKYNSNAFNDF